MIRRARRMNPSWFEKGEWASDLSRYWVESGTARPPAAYWVPHRSRATYIYNEGMLILPDPAESEKLPAPGDVVCIGDESAVTTLAIAKNYQDQPTVEAIGGNVKIETRRGLSWLDGTVPDDLGTRRLFVPLHFVDLVPGLPLDQFPEFKKEVQRLEEGVGMQLRAEIWSLLNWIDRFNRQASVEIRNNLPWLEWLNARARFAKDNQHLDGFGSGHDRDE